MLPFVGVALKVQEELHIHDKKGAGMIMRFAKIYTPEKMGEILRRAKSFPWHYKMPTAAFMKAVGQINREEKEAKENANKLKQIA
jgi:hypothetical protein